MHFCSNAIREISVLMEIQHRNIVRWVIPYHTIPCHTIPYRLFEVIPARTELFLVFEYLDHDLSKYMKTVKHIDHDSIKVRLAFYLCIWKFTSRDKFVGLYAWIYAWCNSSFRATSISCCKRFISAISGASCIATWSRRHVLCCGYSAFSQTVDD